MSRHPYLTMKRMVGKAVHRYGMISDGDKIAVGLSGGKDSLSLMWILTERLSRIPISYELFAIYVDPGFPGSDIARLESYCRDMNYNLAVEHSDFGIRAHSDENTENPCFLCSRLRRKRLFEVAAKLGCDKLALGHHKDDIIETLFMNMCYGGSISTMVPSQSLFNGAFTIIRPLSYVDEDTIRRFALQNDFPVFHNACPSEKTSKRHEMKKMLTELYKINRKIKGNIFRSLSHINTDYLL
ncbi:MAG: tRNA 2-thiocytidine(32) synthetase TtcA [Desulfobacteraceae bacterium]|nr:MAG: tRNA 2-thiocytidine(32) synthetase TtcA [Desulfobacteraceae bacterium]